MDYRTLAKKRVVIQGKINPDATIKVRNLDGRLIREYVILPDRRLKMFGSGEVTATTREIRNYVGVIGYDFTHQVRELIEFLVPDGFAWILCWHVGVDLDGDAAWKKLLETETQFVALSQRHKLWRDE